MAELEELVKLKEWNDLLHVLSQEKKASYRQILAAHTSDCCSPQHEPRMIPSLKDVGLDSPVAFEDKHVVTISLKAMHLGQANDNLSPLIVTSSPQLTVRLAQEQTCQVTLAFLLSVGVDQIRLHPSALANGVESVALLKEAGHKVCVAAGPPAPGTWREWMQQLPPIGPTQVTHRAWIDPMKDKPEVVIEALLQLLHQPQNSSDHRFNPSRLPPHVRLTLEQNRPKKGLKPFLLKHGHIFEVHESGAGPWQFSIKTSSHQPPPPTYTGWCDQAGWSDQTGTPGSSSSVPPPGTTAPVSCWSDEAGWSDQAGMPGHSSSGPSPPGTTAPVSGWSHQWGMPQSSAPCGQPPDSSAPTAGWRDQTGMPGPPGPPGLSPLPPPSVHDDYSTTWEGWHGWSGWEGGTTKESSCSGGGWRGSAEREPPPAEHRWESWNDTSASRTVTPWTVADMVRYRLLPKTALAGEHAA